MIEYLITSIDSHIDKGFGITADAYYKSANHLETNHFDCYESTQQAEMPECFLYRHSIELYLKSLIISFHRKLEINYGTVAFDSDEPEIFTDGVWRKLYTCHFLDKLYDYWLITLLKPNIERLNDMAPAGEWEEHTDITQRFISLSQYDRDSSYFRYPITKNAQQDEEKYSMKRVKDDDIDSIFIKGEDPVQTPRMGKISTLIVDDDYNVIEAYTNKENVLTSIRDSLREVAYYFNCMHAMTRMTLCKGR